MPRLALAKIPASVLQAELERRAKKAARKLRKLLRERATLDLVIAELEAIAGKTFKSVAKVVTKIKRGRKPGPKPGRKPGRKPGPKPALKAPRKRGVFAQTGQEFVLALAKGKGASTGEINRKWIAAGRGGKADIVLSKLTKAGVLKREPLPKGQKGSIYTIA